MKWRDSRALLLGRALKFLGPIDIFSPRIKTDRRLAWLSLSSLSLYYWRRERKASEEEKSRPKF